MFNFNELEIVHPNEPNCPRGSFVGIRKDKYLGKMAFTLPKGFDNFEKSYDNVKKLFFLMYRTFEKFRQSHEQIDEKLNSKDNTQINHHHGAYTFTDEDNNETILYSKIDLIERIFKTYQELEIESLIQELGLVEEVDYSKIENYLDKGIYLNNNAIFIENMQGYRNIVRGVPSELIELFCYIYKELANELEQELSEQIKEIAFNFSYKYLNAEQSLFSEHSFESTISILKDCLDNIHKTTAYKNHQYWDIYEAVEHFLYGSLKFDDEINQGFWGINNFSYIWEEMCNYTILGYEDVKVFYCDRNTKLGLPILRSNLNPDRYIWIDKNWSNIFNIQLHDFKRWIRPDIIFEKIKHENSEIVSTKQSAIKNRKDSIHQYQNLIRKLINPYSKSLNIVENIDSIYLVDWKYYSNDLFYGHYREDERINYSIIKQLTYEYCLSQITKKKISNQFCIPYYDEKDKEQFILDRNQLDCEIELVKINFALVQENYLHD